MTRAQKEAEFCGLIPDEHPPVFMAQHLSAYAFMRSKALNQKVLEVGFGGGYGTAYLAEVATEVVGVDIAPGNIPRARAKHPKPNLTFRHFDGFNLPFPNDMFDAACAFQVIEHIPESQLLAWLTEIKRVIKPQGMFYVSTLNVEHNIKPGHPYEKLIYHEHEFTAGELKLLLERVFKNVKAFGLNYTLIHQFFRRLKKWGLNKLLPPRINIVDQFFQQATVRDFVVSPRRLRNSLDLIGVCQKERSCSRMIK